MEEDVLISISNISKTFLVPHEKHNTLKQSTLNMFSKKKFSKLETLKQVDFNIQRGEFFGIMGRNGCGKSTLLKIIANIYQPTSGKISVNGRLAPFIELGVGFNPDLTGRENVFLSGTILGMKRKEIESKYLDIVDFSELEEFMDQKLKNYSSGMQVRLAFSIAIQADSDILLIDEVLAVGDANFQRKCFKVFKELKASGKTIVFVSHSSDTVRDFCDKVALIEKGELVMVGDPTEVTNQYLEILSNDIENAPSKPALGKKDRWGDGKAIVDKIMLKNAKGTVKKVFGDEIIKVTLVVDFKLRVEEPIIGLVVKDESGQPVFSSNTKWNNLKIGTLDKGKQEVTWEFYNMFDDGSYSVSPAVAYEGGNRFYDWWEGAATFDSRKSFKTGSTINILPKINIKSIKKVKK